MKATGVDRKLYNATVVGHFLSLSNLREKYIIIPVPCQGDGGTI
jgi:hypothetical protein